MGEGEDRRKIVWMVGEEDRGGSGRRGKGWESMGKVIGKKEDGDRMGKGR